MSYLRTAMLLAGLTALFMGVGYLIGGAAGAMIALLVAAGTNLFAYWNSDRMVLSMYGAQEVDARTAPELVGLVAELAGARRPADAARLPDGQSAAERVRDRPQSAERRRRRHHRPAAALSREELAGVIAHELAHIKNHDTLTMTITATIAGAISMLAQFGMFFGGNRDNNNGLGMIGSIAMMILAPLAAMLVQMAISRTREYAADDMGARICGQPMWLASALAKIDERRASDPERGGRAQSGDGAHVHHQPAVGPAAWTICSRPTRRPRTASPRCSSSPPSSGRRPRRRRVQAPSPAARSLERSAWQRRVARTVGVSRLVPAP